MIKRFFLTVAVLAGLVSSSFAAGTIPLSMTQQLDTLGKPLSGCQFYTIQAGTVSTPQNAFQDSALTITLPNPMRCDASGRLPQFFLADGQIKIRLTDKNGVTQVTADNILVIGPSGGGGGGGGTVDPTTVLQTGWLQPIYGTGVQSGFVRLNGRTIGNASSGATERANADTLALFVFLYNQDTGLAVSGGRGASAAVDFAANKTITLPDGRGRAIAALADMGNSNIGIYSGVTFSRANSVTIGGITGAARRSLLLANLPAYTPAGTLSLSTGVSTSVTTTVTGTASVTSTANDFGKTLVNAAGGSGSLGVAGTSAVTSTGSITAAASSSATSTATPTGTFTGNAQGGSSALFDTVSPYMFVTIYIKL